MLSVPLSCSGSKWAATARTSCESGRFRSAKLPARVRTIHREYGEEAGLLHGVALPERKLTSAFDPPMPRSILRAAAKLTRASKVAEARFSRMLPVLQIVTRHRAFRASGHETFRNTTDTLW